MKNVHHPLTRLALAVINTAFADDLTPQVEFKAEYHNGTGYLDALMDEDIGTEPVKMIDDQGRRILVIPNPRKNLVLFERDSSDTPRICAHYHKADIIAGYDDSGRYSHIHSGWAGEEALQPWLLEYAVLNQITAAV